METKAESRTERLKKTNYWNKLFELRDQDRQNKKDAIYTVIGEELPWEVNCQGLMRWYLHPSMEDTIINPFIFYVQEIPPGSRSGRLKVQGGQIFYIWEGKGYTVMDGVKYPWAAGSVVQIPLKPMGVIYQHFNMDEHNPARLISCEANNVGALGMDKGSGFEQLENCPEYDKQKDQAKS